MNNLSVLNNSSLKEYYVNLQKLYNNAVNILTGITQTLSTSASEVDVLMLNNDNSTTTVKLPSFIYLESKLENIENKLNTLFKIPESGEAWFDNGGNMSKLKLIKSVSTPIVPEIKPEDIKNAFFKDNNILRDMVSPKTYLKVNVDNLGDNIEEMFMKKIIIKDELLYNELVNYNNTITYNECKAALAKYNVGDMYEEYDSILRLPVKSSTYNSLFTLDEIINTYIDPKTKKRRYEIRVNTLEYYDVEDTSHTFTLQVNDKIVLTTEYVIYNIIKIDDSDVNKIIIEEELGHINLQTYDVNTSMVFSLYQSAFNNFHYVEVPLEEDKYIILFLGTVYDNVRSNLTNGICIDLSSIIIKDQNGKDYKDSNNKSYTYIEYYNKYCQNIGDLIKGLSDTAYPQISNYTYNALSSLINYSKDKIEDAAATQAIVTSTVDLNNINVVQINTHLLTSDATEELQRLNANKSKLSNDLIDVQGKINELNDTLMNTDFSKNSNTLSRESLKEQLDSSYAEKIKLQKQFTTLVNDINTISENMFINKSDAKYRVRGILNSALFESYLQTPENLLRYNKCNIVKLDIEYKYKQIDSTTINVKQVNNNNFTSWNKQSTKERDRYINFKNGSISIEYDNEEENDIKWNQIDIPIQDGEDVVFRVRYKYNIGQPFINLYSPWSDEITIQFPEELKDDTTITNILLNNESDVITAKLTERLVDDGITEHTSDSMLDNQKKYLHTATKIYSGFNTSENAMLSVEEKMKLMDNDLTLIKTNIDSIINDEYVVSIQYEGNDIELIKDSTNVINYFNTTTDMTFNKINFIVTIKNKSENQLRLYSILPGDDNTPLLLVDNSETVLNTINNYERVPMIVNKTITPQVLNQWVYFRQNDPHTHESIYYSDKSEETRYKQIIIDGKEQTEKPDRTPLNTANNILLQPNNQQLFGYRIRSLMDYYNKTFWGRLYRNENNQIVVNNSNNKSTEYIENYSYVDFDFFVPNDQDNNFIVQFENIYGIKNGVNCYLGKRDNINEFINEVDIKNDFFKEIKNYTGAFVYPDIQSLSLITINKNKTNKNSKIINPGESASFNLTLEYFFGDQSVNQLIKSLYFDIKTSLFTDPHTYKINFIINQQANTAVLLSNNLQLVDNVTEI